MSLSRDIILLDHGSGGQLSSDLVDSLFIKYFGKPNATMLTDSALVSTPSGKLAITTDSFVVKPLFFPGGNIGKLAVCGTVNDLAVAGAKALFLTSAFIIEEGFRITELETIVQTMAEEAKVAGVSIIAGDTKVVEKGSADGVFINTTGIGVQTTNSVSISNASCLEAGDVVIINGSIAEHGLAVMGERHDFNFETPIHSDCASLNGLIDSIMPFADDIRFMRDATRGGLATVCCELAEGRNLGVVLQEEAIPVSEAVRGYCELLGFDPLYVANEGKVVVVVSQKKAQIILETMRKHPLGKDSVIIGTIVSDSKGHVVLATLVGGKRIVQKLAGAQLPRIC